MPPAAKMWPYVTEAVNKEAKCQLPPLIAASKPTWMGKIELQKCASFAGSSCLACNVFPVAVLLRTLPPIISTVIMAVADHSQCRRLAAVPASLLQL